MISGCQKGNGNCLTSYSVIRAKVKYAESCLLFLKLIINNSKNYSEGGAYT